MTSTKTVAPVITRIEGSKGDIPDGGTTEDTMVDIFGTAKHPLIVQLFNNGDSLGAATIDANGEWFFRLVDLNVGEHAITAETVEGTSPAWKFKVEAPQEKR
ncbi:hypothetical protein ACYZTM_20815 [Pseudomonas sp. MDT2-39-1]